MTTLTADTAALFARVADATCDAERDHWLALAADELCEMPMPDGTTGHPLADCVRLVLPRALAWLAPEGGEARRPNLELDIAGNRRWRWNASEAPDGQMKPDSAHQIPIWCIRKLPDWQYEHRPSWRWYDSPAAAYLALADVLAPLVAYWDRRPERCRGGWRWFLGGELTWPLRVSSLPPNVYGWLTRSGSPHGDAVYPTEQAAMLALLEALAPKEE